MSATQTKSRYFFPLALLLYTLSCSSVQKEIINLNNSDFEIRQKAIVYLSDRLEQVNSSERQEIVCALKNVAAKDKNEYIRAQVLSELVKRAPNESREIIATCLRDSSPLVRSEAVRATTKLKTPDFLPYLLNLLSEDNETSVRQLCPDALIAIASENCEVEEKVAEALYTRLEDSEDSVKYACKQALNTLLRGNNKDKLKKSLEKPEDKK